MRGRDAAAPLIAVVDDDQAMCHAISSLVRSTGYRCAAFPSAEAFLASGIICETNCILLDVHMRGMDGLDLHSALGCRYCPAPVIYVTATRDGVLRERAVRQGAAAFLEKPFDGEELLREIGKALGGSGSTNGSRS